MEQRINAEIKKIMVDDLTDKLTSTPGIFFTNFCNLDANQMNILRRRLKENNSELSVVKNSLLTLAMRQTKLDGFDDLVGGELGLIFSEGDPIATSRCLVEFGRKNEDFKIRGAILERQLLSLNDIKEFAVLSGKGALLGKLVAVVSSPLRGVAGVLSSLMNGLVTTLEQIKDKVK
jgi:large subunit ribosomal protein L10